MIAMQYHISLPTDYDMEIIRKRVQDSGHKTDGFPDLKMKAYLIAEKTKYGNGVNQYAPFYLWEKADGMNQFLLGGPFNNIINSFGRPAVQNWVVLHELVKKEEAPQYAAILTTAIPAYSDFADLCQRETENFANWTGGGSTTAYVAAYNPLSWELCHFYMSKDLEALQKLAQGSLIYDVHHIS